MRVHSCTDARAPISLLAKQRSLLSRTVTAAVRKSSVRVTSLEWIRRLHTHTNTQTHTHKKKEEEHCASKSGHGFFERRPSALRRTRLLFRARRPSRSRSRCQRLAMGPLSLALSDDAASTHTRSHARTIQASGRAPTRAALEVPYQIRRGGESLARPSTFRATLAKSRGSRRDAPRSSTTP